MAGNGGCYRQGRCTRDDANRLSKCVVGRAGTRAPPRTTKILVALRKSALVHPRGSGCRAPVAPTRLPTRRGKNGKPSLVQISARPSIIRRRKVYERGKLLGSRVDCSPSHWTR